MFVATETQQARTPLGVQCAIYGVKHFTPDGVSNPAVLSYKHFTPDGVTSKPSNKRRLQTEPANVWFCRYCTIFHQAFFPRSDYRNSESR
jgi:hypothetical protein